MVAKNWIPELPLNGHMYAYGRTDSGKTWKLITVLQFYHSHNYKIWDLWGGKRKEGGFWCFPSDEKHLWFEYQKEVGDMTEPGPKKYKVNLYYPMLMEEIPNELPEDKPRISAKPFTLFFKDVEIDEITTITGGLSKRAQSVWKKIKKQLPDTANGEDILNWFEKKENKQFKRLTLYDSFIQPFCEYKVLTDKAFAINLNIIDESEDKEVVSVLMDDYVPEEYKMFFILHILKKIYVLAENDLIHRKSIAFFRELNYFMKVQDESKQDGEQKQIMREQFSNVLRYGRSAILIAGDTQSPSEVKGLVEGQDDLLLLNELPGARDREVACDRLVSDGKMSPQQRDYLGSIEITKDKDGNSNFKGKMVVVERGQTAKLINRVQPPRTKCFKRSDGSFLRVWKKISNKWINISDIKKKLNDSYLFNKHELKTETIYESETPPPEVEPVSEEKEDIEIEEEVVQEEKPIVNIEKERYKELKREKLIREINEPFII